MFPASTKGGGQCFAFPDVCKTPAPPAPFVPIPYPNIAMPADASGGTVSSKVKIEGKEVCTTKTEITMSSGDEGGTAGGGMISSKFKGPAKYKKGSSKVSVEGNPVVHLTSMIGQNDSGNPNMPAGNQVAPSQTKVTVMP
jgi:hypothetical protein